MMLNILIPCMGKSAFYKDSFFPKILHEIKGKTMLQRVIDNYKNLGDCRFIFCFNSEECKKFHIDESARLLADNVVTIALENETAGALCTCLMAIDYINNNDKLVICNNDQIIDVNYQDVIDYFDDKNADVGVISFSSVHPRWSYVKIIDEVVVEAAEKRPISNNAIAGFYYFNKGSDFVKAASNSILKNNSNNGVFYISSSVNEAILLGKQVVSYHIENDQYHTFYTPEKIKEYENEN